MIQRILLSVTVSAVCGVGAAVADITVNYQTGTTQYITGVTNPDTTGEQMAGTSVTAFFLNGTSQTLTWAPYTQSYGHVISSPTNGWELRAGAGMNFGWFTLSNDTSSGLERVVIDLAPGAAAFDAVVSPWLTEGSKAGNPFAGLNVASGLDLVATYRDQVTLVGAAPLGDLYRSLEVRFTNTGGLAWNQSVKFYSDVDSVAYAAQPVPVPGAALLALTGLPFIGWIKQRFGETSRLGRS